MPLTKRIQPRCSAADCVYVVEKAHQILDSNGNSGRLRSFAVYFLGSQILPYIRRFKYVSVKQAQRIKAWCLEAGFEWDESVTLKGYMPDGSTPYDKENAEETVYRKGAKQTKKAMATRKRNAKLDQERLDRVDPIGAAKSPESSSE